MKWRAHDANDDDLVYSVYYRADGETRWKQLRDGVENRYVNLESDLFADGGYTVSGGRFRCTVAFCGRNPDRTGDQPSL